jgi:spore coat protein JB
MEYQYYFREPTQGHSLVVDPDTALKRGVSFESLNKEYKGYTGIMPTAHNEREQKLIDIMKHSILAHDLHLYLDMYPEDTRAMREYKHHINETYQMTREYEQKYGSLTLGNEVNLSQWDWNNSPWPWEVV